MFKTLTSVLLLGTLAITLSTRVSADSEPQYDSDSCHGRCESAWERCCRNTSPCPDDVVHVCFQDVRCCNLACDGHDCQRN